MMQENGCHGYREEQGERVGLRLDTGSSWSRGGVTLAAGHSCCNGNVPVSGLIHRLCAVIWREGALGQNLWNIKKG